ncbi:MAG: HDOD domain-containing protein [Candidatus Krumholzibacteriia bacterium]
MKRRASGSAGDRDLPPALADRLAHLPRLSAVVSDFLTLARKEYLTAREFESVLAGDPVLRAWLLRQANSGFFNLARPVRTLAEASVVIGLERLQRMVYAVCSRDLLDHRLKVYHYPDQGFWLHAMAVGVTARMLVDAASPPGPGSPPGAGGRSDLGAEEAFVAGLLHDAGKRVLDGVLPTAGGPRLVSRDDEREACGLDHAQISARIAASWSLPPSVVVAVAEHHGTAGAEAVEAGSGAALVGLADALCNTWGLGVWVYPRLKLEPDVGPWLAVRRALLLDDDRAWEVLLARLRPVLGGLAEMLRLCRVNPVVDRPSPESADAAGDDRDAAGEAASTGVAADPQGDASTSDGSCVPTAAADRRSERREDRTRRGRSHRGRSPHRGAPGKGRSRRRF